MEHPATGEASKLNDVVDGDEVVVADVISVVVVVVVVTIGVNSELNVLNSFCTFPGS